MIKYIIALVLGFIGAVAYKLCVPVMFLLIACKLWYEPFTWNWLNVIAVPLCWGVCGFFATLIAEDIAG